VVIVDGHNERANWKTAISTVSACTGTGTGGGTGELLVFGVICRLNIVVLVLSTIKIIGTLFLVVVLLPMFSISVLVAAIIRAIGLASRNLDLFSSLLLLFPL
jgi:hypothetical protein